MCRWGCTTTDTSYMCRYCGTRYCKECLHGEFPGEMKAPDICRMCNQPNCQGQRVEYVPGHEYPREGDKKRGKSGKKSGKKGKKSGKKKGKKSGKKGKKSGKKKKKK
ncbi:PREDICTED: cGMP-gated cation channel alpha-1-like [Branchiostoma belcheri]|uniref:cGMP-gated cation channel alpha-1-like n=1 Tax=Branchiostoma belcheri TaxID=7741 RepID=A0A6P4ZDW2_BRABE|nr:PREDICTED: cGMP-gated cation channel alpha-1-like [Branchiostoma belcheri]KAI8495757.1 hypothetical protein Bbelb_267290 [Branchiostoma belcheri]